MATETKKNTKPAAKAAPKAAAPAPAKKEAVVDTRSSLERRKMVVGTVTSNKMQKTIVVKVDHRVRHSAYKKYIVRSVKFKAHDEKNEAKVGDRVALVESRPLSRDKRWVLQSIVRKASQVAEANV